MNANPAHASCLEPRTIAQLKGFYFRIPSYQRGYRWERRQVHQLLDDIAEAAPNDDNPYYLQPIVVSPTANADSNAAYDLIDGQQRLTTIYLILQALHMHQTAQTQSKISFAIDNSPTDVDFDIVYESRSDSRDFLRDISTIHESDPRIIATPDHLYMWHAYQTILEWLDEASYKEISHVVEALKNAVNIIWYELPDSITDWKKFADLNIGKISLTNSELLKALFLRAGNFCAAAEKHAEEYIQQTFVAQWDQIERELNHADFWGFLTREAPEAYPTKIDLFFDLVAGKAQARSTDTFYTFNYFVDWFKANPKVTGWQKWQELFLQYQRLRDWFAERDTYHKLGYLVAIDFPKNALEKVFNFAYPKSKTVKRHNRSTAQVAECMDHLIKLSLKFPKTDKFSDVASFRDLKYNCADEPDSKFDPAHHPMIKRYLTLYNIMVTETVGKDYLRYPFASHNGVAGGWSLEHVHAQRSQTLDNKNQWGEWVKNHLESLERIKKEASTPGHLIPDIDALIKQMQTYDCNKERAGNKFVKITEKFREIMEKLPGANGLYKDEMANMALLGRNDNSTLNNSTFDVKRQKVIDQLSTNFVPIATERIFLKAIKNCDTDHLFFWGETDREAYMNDMQDKLKKYL